MTVWKALLPSTAGQPVERVHADSERDNWMTAEEACAYGLVDKVVASGFASDEKKAE